MSNRLIIEIGSYDGMNSLKEYENGDCDIYTFEPQKDLYYDLNFRTKDNKNYKVIDKAVSSITGNKNINITNDKKYSSLYNIKTTNLEKKFTYSGLSYNVDTIRLDDFINKNGLKDREIYILDCRVQGIGYEVLLSLGEYLKYVKNGIISTVEDLSKSIYDNENNKDLDYIKKYLEENNFVITTIQDSDINYEKIIFFTRKTIPTLEILQNNLNETNENSQLSIGVVTLNIGDEYKKTYELCIKSLVDYCLINNYELIKDDTLSYTDIKLSKINLILNTISLNKYDYIVWINSNVLICNYESKLENLIYTFMRSNNFMMCRDIDNMINTDFMFIKSNKYTHNILESIFYFKDSQTEFSDKEIFNELYNKNIFDLKNNSLIFKEEEQRIFNSNLYAYKYGDFSINYKGIKSQYWLKQLTRDFYSKKLEDENETEYNSRILKLKEKISNPKYILPNIDSYKEYNSISILSLVDDNNRNIFKYSLYSIINYSERNNYTHNIIHKQDLTYLDKYRYIYKCLTNYNYEYIVYIDPKILITNYDIKLENIINNYMKDKSILLTKNIFDQLNSNIMIIKNNEYTRNLFTLLVNFENKFNESNDLIDIISNNFYNIINNTVLLDRELHYILNCCISHYTYGIFNIEFFHYSLIGMEKGFNDFYPEIREGESPEEYNFRLNWIKSFNK